jgi:hypothetical protein
MYLNDKLGCCVISAAAHMVQEWTAYAGNEQRLSDADVLKGYEDVGGYVPGDPTTDNGCDMITALNYWRQTGFGGHKIYAYASVNPRNEKEVEQATWLFGNLFVGLALPISAQQSTDWEVPSEGLTGDGSPGSWGGHCISSISNSDKGQTDVTWGGTIWETKGFRRSYCDELFAILTQDWIDALTQQAASGFNLAQLQADLKALAA